MDKHEAGEQGLQRLPTFLTDEELRLNETQQD